MPSQSEYGSSSDRMLVPGTLRVFRHFWANTETGQLTPMNYNPGRDPYGFGYSRSQPYREQAEPYEATCTKGLASRLTGYAPPPPQHNSPHSHCTCGFYAHYKQADDFYPHHLWGKDYFNDLMQYSSIPLVMVRAVCEVSGTVVAGSRGVRAGKMKIVALAVDWDKYRNPTQRLREVEGLALLKQIDYHTFEYGNPTVEIIDSRTPGTNERSRITSTVELIARRYGVEFYDRWKDMYLDHPEEDLTALGIEYKPAPEDMWSSTAYSFRQMASTQATFYANAVAATDKAAKEMRTLLDELFATPKQKPKVSLVKPVKSTQFERVMLAKKNRSAPPGTGIDRRRGRLR